jgi:dienelactone hydrolase
MLLCLSSITRAQHPAQKVAADAFLTALIERAWDRVEALEHPTLRDKITSAQWAELMDGLEKQGGKIQRHEFYSAEANGAYASVVHRVHLLRDSIGVRMVVDSMNLIGGFWLDPIKKDYKFPVAEYMDTTSFVEQAATVGTEFPLAAMLSIPKGDGPFPGVVLVHGSGPHDMDETIGGNKTFRDLAWGLASRGIMVLRYDKRTLHYGNKMNALTVTVQDETIDDAILALELLRDQPACDTTRLILCGHSLGAMLAPEIAAHMPSVDGVVMLAPIARPLETVISDQLRFIASQQDSLTPTEDIKLRSELEKCEEIRKGTLMKTKRLLGMPASYFYDLQKRDQKAYALQLDIPMFIARGTKDYQAPQMEMVLWKEWLAGKQNVTFRSYKDAYHLFIATDAKPGPWNYQQEGNIMPELIDDLATWCLELPAGGEKE